MHGVQLPEQGLDGLDPSDYFGRNGQNDHWWVESRKRAPNYVTPRPPKGLRVTWSHVSASQIENYTKCKRSWYFKSILKVPEIQKDHQALGTSFHLILEKVPKGLGWPQRADTNATVEDWDKANQLAKIALPLLPLETPKISIKREWAIRMPTYQNGPTFIGYVDLGIPPGIGWPALMIPANEAIIGDYKTTSDFRYIKTPEELAQSVQMMSYAKAAISEWPGGLVLDLEDPPDTVRLLHLYARTKPPFTRASIRESSAIVTAPEINTFWNRTLDIVREMQQSSFCTNSDDMEANGALNGHCEAYGGCAFRERCGIGKESNISTLFQIKKKSPLPTGNINMSGSAILNKILAAREAAKVPAPETKSEPTVSAADQVKAGPVAGLLAKLQAKGDGTPQLSGELAKAYGAEIGSPDSQGFAGTGTLAKTPVSSVADLVKLASGVVPPDAPSRRQEVITTPGQPVADPNQESESNDEENTQETPDSPGRVSVGQSATNGSDPGQSMLKRRGRPSKEETLAKEAAEKAKFEQRVQAEVSKRLEGVNKLDIADPDKFVTDITKALDHERALTQLHDMTKERDRLKIALDSALAAKVSVADPAGCTLYVDCYPTKGEREGLVDFFEWIQPIATAVAESNSVADYRMIPYNSKAFLATSIRELVKAEGMPKAMTIPTYAAGADVALEILSPLAKRVIRKLS